MTKTDVFNFLQQFNNMKVRALNNPIESSSIISGYNDNIYAVPESDDFLFYVEYDDIDVGAWYLCDKNQNIICYFGNSDGWDDYLNEKIEVFKDIKYFEWENTRMLED